MSKCNQWNCDKDADEKIDDGFCILHSPSENKDRDAFEEALAARNGPQDTFCHIVFPPNFAFHNKEFVEPDFRYSKFMGRIRFCNAKFRGLSKFQNAIFAGTADFLGATFFREANFKDAQFMEDAKFSRAQFKGGVNFQGVTFLGDADFSHAQFGEAGNNSDPKVTKYANFSQATFARRAVFTCVRFYGVEADFSHVRFADEAIFCNVEFAKQKYSAYFLDARFAKEANFVEANFPKGAQFRSAEFEKGAIFIGTTLAGGVVFDGARFSGRTLFEGKGTENQDRIFSEADVLFTNVMLDPLDAVTFRDADLTKCRFLGTDLRKLEITNATWPEMPRPFPLSPKRFGVYDDVAPPGKSETRDWSHIERVYRELKQNYEDRRDYERASDFHFGEKEMRRKNPKTSPGLKFLLIAYWLVCGYGERWIRPLLWAVFLCVIFGLLYLWSGLRPKVASDVLPFSEWVKAFEYSLRVMTLLRPDELGLVANGCVAKVVYYLESIAGPVLIGLLGLAIRQRLKR